MVIERMESLSEVAVFAATAGAVALALTASAWGADSVAGIDYAVGELPDRRWMVVVADDARIYAAPDEASGSFGFYAEISEHQWPSGILLELLRDEGDWLYVRSPGLDFYSRACNADLFEHRVLTRVDWIGWIKASATLTVVTVPQRFDFPDGTWIELLPGTVIQTDETGHPHALVHDREPPRWAVPLPRLPDNVGSSYPWVYEPTDYGLAWLLDRDDRDMPARAWINGLAMPEEYLMCADNSLFLESDDAHVRDGLEMRFRTRCARLGMRVEPGPLPRCPNRCGGHLYRAYEGSYVAGGADVFTPEGGTLGRLPKPLLTQQRPRLTDRGLVCFSGGALRGFGLVSESLADTCTSQGDCICVLQEDVIIDPVWRHRDVLHLHERSDADTTAVRELIARACVSCRDSGGLKAFFEEGHGAATLEVALTGELNGMLGRVGLIEVLRILGEAELADALDRHHATLMALTPRD